MADSPPRRRGRPPLDPSDPAPSTNVHVRLPAKQYDVLYSQAVAARMTVPQFIRAELQRRLVRA
jgi:hypothetical protein